MGSMTKNSAEWAARRTARNRLKALRSNWSQRAANGEIDPIVGRSAEIERTIQVLCRRKKNNPLYVGEPGVGKTALAEGLALKISEGDVPEVLQGRKGFRARYGRGAWPERVTAAILSSVSRRSSTT